MEHLSKEIPPNVQTAKEPNPENSNIKNNAEIDLSSVPKPPVFPVDVTKLNPSMLETAEGLGIPIKSILKGVDDLQKYNFELANYNISVESRLQTIVSNFEPAVKATINKMVAEAQKTTPPAPLPTPSTSSPVSGSQPNALGMIGQLAPLLTQYLGGAQQDPFIELAKQSFLEDAALARTFFKGFMQNALGKMGSNLANDVANAAAAVSK